MDVAILGGGICGLSLALNLKERGVACRVYERAPEIRELGVGITLLPHAMREFRALGLGDALLKVGIENRDCAFFNRFGQLFIARTAESSPDIPFRKSESTAADCTWPCMRQCKNGSALMHWSPTVNASAPSRMKPR